MIAGLVVGLGIAEAVFWIRDDGAFSHVAFYVSAERSAAAARSERAREVLVVGDSQVYGLGVEGDATFASVLATTAPGTTVLNGGVPTYGPFEYAAVVDEVVRTRRPSHVVFVVNLANDLFEATRRNSERHAIGDGWAVRKETMPADFVDFPGRRLLFSRSHLVFALRKLLTPTLPPGDDRGLPSEGGWRDLATTAAQAHPPAPLPQGPGSDRRPARHLVRWAGPRRVRRRRSARRCAAAVQQAVRRPAAVRARHVPAVAGRARVPLT